MARRGRASCETDVEATDLETLIHDLLDGQHSNPVHVVSFNTAEGWSRDISADVAEELRRRCELEIREIPPKLEGLFARYESDPPAADASPGLAHIFAFDFLARTGTRPRRRPGVQVAGPR